MRSERGRVHPVQSGKQSQNGATAKRKRRAGKKPPSRSMSRRILELADRAAGLDISSDKLSSRRLSSSHFGENGCIIHSDGLFRTIWDAILVIFIIYITFMSPLSAALDIGDIDVENPWTPLAIIDVIIDTVFIVDIVMNFHTSYFDKQGVEVTSKEDIRRKYFKTWFAVDLVSSVPLSMFQIIVLYVQRASIADSQNSEDIGAALQVSRMIRFLKIFRLVKSVRIISKSASIEINKNKKRLLRDLGILVVLLHLTACTYIFVAFYGGVAESFHGSWAALYLPDLGSLEGYELNIELYISALYWAVATLTTVGFGDVVPANTAERVVAIVTMLITAAYYGYLIASMASGVSAGDANLARTNKRMEHLSAYTKAKRFPRALRRKIEAYYHSYYQTKTTVNEIEILTGLSVGLRREVTAFMLNDVKAELLSNMELFKDLERPVLAKLFLGLTPQNFAAGDSVMEQGQAERSLFILLAGTIEIDNDHIPHNPETLLEVGASFGELQFLSLRPTSVLDLTTKTPCKLWTISRKDFLDVMDDTDDTVSRIVSAAVTVYQNYVGLFEEQGVEAVVESRRTRYIAEVARYDVIDNERRILFERLHADAGTDTGTGTGTGAPEVEYNPTAGGDSMRSGMWLNGSSLGDNPPRSRRGSVKASTRSLMASTRSLGNSVFGGGRETSTWSLMSQGGSAPSSAHAEVRLNKFQAMFNSRLAELHKTLDQIGAPDITFETSGTITRENPPTS